MSIYFTYSTLSPSYFILKHNCQTRATWLRHKWHKCNTKANVWHECNTTSTMATQVKNFDFDNDTSENIFSHPYISYMANEKWQGQEEFHSKNYLLESTRSHAKMHLKSVPQKLNFVMTKTISKSYTLDCTCKCSRFFPYSYR